MKQKLNNGTTLIELIIYVAILGFISTAFITMSINILSIKSKSIAQQELDMNLQFISQKINYEIRNAQSISGTTASSLTLINTGTSRSPVVFDLNNGDIRMGFDGNSSCPSASPCVLNSDKIIISNFTVTNLSSGDSKTQNVSYSITANYINSSSRPEFNAFGTITDSIEIRSR